MNKKVIMAVKLLILLVLLGGVGCSAYKDYQMTLEARDLKREIVSQFENKENRNEFIEAWKKANLNRAGKAGMCLFYFIVIGGLVIYAGPKINEKKSMTREEANELVRQIEESYIEKGQFAAKEDEDFADDLEVPDSLDMPVLKDAVYKDQHVHFTWRPVRFAQGYIVWRKTETSKWERLARVASKTEYDDYQIESDTKYIYSIRAFCTVNGNRVISPREPLGKEVHVTNGNLLPAPELYTEVQDGNCWLKWKPVAGTQVYRILKKGEDDEEWIRLDKVSIRAGDQYLPEGGEPGTRYSVSACRFVKRHLIVGPHDEEGIALENA